MSSKLAMHRNTLILHFTVLIWGFTGVLGELISVSALYLVWYRVGIAAVALLIYFWCIRKPFAVPLKKMLRFSLVGMIVGLHWVFFFHSIKISTVSVTLVTLSSVTLFTAILEPLINRKKISLSDIGIGFVIIIGIYFIFKFEFQYFWGIFFGLICALLASIFSILNAKMVKSDDATVIAFYEMIGAFIGVSLILGYTGDFNEQMLLGTADLLYLLLLGIFCTAFAYVLGVAVMRELSAFTLALTVNLEPIYGIILALLIFGEKEAMSVGFYMGAVIVLSAVFVYPYVKSKIMARRVLGR